MVVKSSNECEQKKVKFWWNSSGRIPKLKFLCLHHCARKRRRRYGVDEWESGAAGKEEE